MSADQFSVYLHNLHAKDVGFRVIDDGRHVLDITSDVSLYVRPGTDDVAPVAEGLRKLAEAASEMAEALDPGRLEDAAAQDPDVPGDPFPGHGARISNRIGPVEL